jgi:hypothetical protein
MSNKGNTALPNSDSKPRDEKRKVNVFEYSNLANNTKKMRFEKLNKPLQRTDIIHLENSLDFDKATPEKNSTNKNTVVTSQNLLKNNIKFPQPSISKKISLKSFRMSDNDDRKTFISSTDRQMDTASNKSRRQITKQTFKVKKSKQLENLTNSVIKHQSGTPQKVTVKNTEAGIIITKRFEGQRVVNKQKKIVLDSKYLTKQHDVERFISHKRKATEVGPNPITQGKYDINL